MTFGFQAQQFVLTLKNLQSLNDVPDHVKNYRPKVLVFSGIPAHRQPLVDFANLITKKFVVGNTVSLWFYQSNIQRAA